MPSTSLLPAPPVEWWAEYIFPQLPIGTAFPSSINVNLAWGRSWTPSPQTLTNVSAGTSGGTGVQSQIVSSSAGGRILARTGSDAASVMHSFVFPWWLTPSGDAAFYNPGYQEMSSTRVAWIRVGFRTSVAPPAAWGEATGFFLVPYNGTGINADYLPTGPSFRGGVGYCYDGAGGAQYRSFDAAGVALETVPVPASPNFTRLSVLDFIVRGSNADTPGWLTMRVNGADVVTERPFGPLLVAPQDLTTPGSQTYALAIGSRNASVGAPLHEWWVESRFGRFLPDGVEVRS